VPSVQPASPFDLGLFGHLISRALRTITFYLLLLVGGGITGALALRSVPVYQSEAVLLYQDRATANPVALQRGDVPSPRRIGLALQEMLFSHTLLEKLIKEFNLYGKAVERFGLVAAVDQMQKKDLHFATREGYTFRISYDSTSPETAQKVTARATELLIETHVGARVDEVKDTERFLSDEKQRVEKELRERESELSLFLTKNPEVVDVGTGRSAATDMDDGSAGDTASLGFEMQALQLRERLAQLREQPATATLGQPGSPTHRLSDAQVQAEIELASAQRELAEKRMQFTEEYPDVKRALLRAESAKARLRHLESGGSAPTPTPVAGAQAAEAPAAAGRAFPAETENGEARMLQQQIELLEKQMRASRSHGRRPQPRSAAAADPNQLGRLRAQYVELDRQARESREHLALLGDRKFQAEMQALFASQAKRSDLVVVDPAFKPVTPLRSARTKVIGIGAVISVLLALSVGLLIAIRDDRIRRPADLRRFDLPPLLCEVPPP